MAWRLLPAVLAAFVVASVGAVAGLAHVGNIPTQLVGKWKRTVTSADVERSGTRLIPAGTVCTLTVQKSGALNLYLDCPSLGAGVAGTARSLGAHRVDMNVAAFGPTVYRWRVSGRQLTLTKIKDRKPIRAVVLWGRWTRK